MPTRSSVRRRGDDHGAAAVEFALLVPILFSILFGIIDYGFWFNDSLNVRQGVREAARQGVVQNFVAAGCTTGSDMQKLACKANYLVEPTDPTPTDAYTRVVVPAGGWTKGQPLLVCSMVQADGLTGFVPLPADGLIKSKTTMSIEVQATVIAAGTTTSGTPSGGSWSWCA